MPVVGAAWGADQLLNGGNATKGVGKALGGLGDIGKNDYQGQDFTHSGEYDPNAFEYGGHPGGAQAQADQYGNTAGNYTNGAYENFTNSGNTFGAAGEDRNAAYGSRGQQEDALGLIADRAKGNNLIANQVAAQQSNQLAAQQQGLAAGARGPAALALAQQGAAANTSAGQAQIAGQAAIAAAQEKLANEQAYLGGASGIRGQDINQMGATTALGSAQGNMAAQQGQLGLGYSGLQNKVQEDQLNAQMQRQGLQAQSQTATQGINAGVSQANAANEWNLPKMVLGAGTSAGSIAAAASDPFSKTGISPLGFGGPESNNGMVLGQGGGLDAAASERATSDLDTKYFHNAGSNPMGQGGGQGMGGILGFLASDPDAKTEIADTDGEPDVVSGLHSQFDQPKAAKKKPSMSQMAQYIQTPEFDMAASDHLTRRLQLPQVSDPAAKKDAFVEGMGYMKRVQDYQSGGPKPGEPPQYTLGQEEKKQPATAQVGQSAVDLAHGKFLTPGQREFLQDPYQGQPITPAHFLPPALRERLLVDQQPAVIQFPRDAETAHSQLVSPTNTKATPPLPQPAASDPRSKTQIGPQQAGAAVRKVVEGAKSAAGHVKDSATRAAGAVSKKLDEAPDDIADALGHLYPEPSDPRAKVLGGVHDNEIAKTLDATPAVSYKYKSDYFEPNAQKPGERQAGFLTTDLKRTPLGAAVVEERPDGYEGYNTHRMIGLQFAGLRNVHERLRDLEALLAEKTKKVG